jgi:hypothetical protein
MDANAIQLVSKALQDRVKAAFAAQGIPGDVYIGPLDEREAEGAAAVLFLYRVAVNADLRNAEHVVQPPGPTPVTIHEGALPLDLYYLLTARRSQPGRELDALRVLGFAMQALNDTPDLVGLPVQGETVRLTFDPISSEEMSRIWTLFPTTNYRTSVVYLASPVWIDPASPRAPGPPVVEEPHRVWQLEPGV